jgi:hypothetical protein
VSTTSVLKIIIICFKRKFTFQRKKKIYQGSFWILDIYQQNLFVVHVLCIIVDPFSMHFINLAIPKMFYFEQKIFVEIKVLFLFVQRKKKRKEISNLSNILLKNQKWKRNSGNCFNHCF